MDTSKIVLVLQLQLMGWCILLMTCTPGVSHLPGTAALRSCLACIRPGYSPADACKALPCLKTQGNVGLVSTV